MVSASTLSAMFRSGDMPERFRPKRLAQYWVVQTVKDDPVRCLAVYADLREKGGTAHAAELFRALVEEARSVPFRFKARMLGWLDERPSRLPA